MAPSQLLLDILGEGIFDRSSRWILAAFFVSCVSTGVAIGVGVLFCMQLQQVAFVPVLASFDKIALYVLRRRGVNKESDGEREGAWSVFLP